MDACPEDLAVYIREKVLRDLEGLGKKADLYLLVCKRNLSDQPRRSTQTVMESVRPRQPERKVISGQSAGEHKKNTNNQRSYFKCKI
ncbi:hypothetical protein PoB_003437200 [Plakobranchus ocellatus]|uniref:Uncharacterized protein n=1 Tax=Plakobranchus ocellatus TaxID=259542 RepID=A0AAV4AKU1_9GAST|nr:hypothetical protein PoB_003437200 [Plakobranchus ocellatus]